jgi:integrase
MNPNLIWRCILDCDAGQCIFLLWENADLEARVAIIPRTKNDDQVVVPLNDAAMRAFAVFRARGDGRGRVVRNAAGKTLTVNAHWFIPAVRRVGSPTSIGTTAARLTPVVSDRRELRSETSRNYWDTRSSNDETLRHLSISNLHEAVSRISNNSTVAPERNSKVSANSYVN